MTSRVRVEVVGDERKKESREVAGRLAPFKWGWKLAAALANRTEYHDTYYMFSKRMIYSLRMHDQTLTQCRGLHNVEAFIALQNQLRACRGAFPKKGKIG